MEFKGKKVIVTGANGGLGKEILRQFAEEGANIWACVRNSNEDFRKYISQLGQQHGVWIKEVCFDLEDEESVKTGIKNIINEKKDIDILINNAGVPYGALLQMTPIHELRKVFEINFFMQILIMQLVSRKMIKQKKGCIINMASVGGIETKPGFLAYGSSKAALIWATKSIANELVAYNIRVNAVAPGLTDTRMGHFNSEKEVEKFISETGMKRMAQPEEIAHVILFLASEKASYITGQILSVDGGR